MINYKYNSDAARKSHDQLYIATDISLKIHAGISDHEKMRICSTLKHEKLSAEAVRHFSRNLAFPSETKPRLNINRQNRMKSLLQKNDHLKSFFDSMFLKTFKNIIIDVKEDAKKETMLYDGDEGIHSSGTQLASLKKIENHTLSLSNAAVYYLLKLCIRLA
ncbi:hypothetical protein HN51_027117 [Arachis hypogaea]|uniref:BTB/POZ domain-containing protein At3g22104 isoform X3 n=1 Tax=Arachis duranensis TaxID=130453 RepID=A0A6P4C493_ARADU|nr:BTB/POZ domain-containing protein At3g22104 isoform X3 [Arachis duranensis]XP_025617956.1 BTB/POZ domain-containing protein At3g22104 isoform X3 [Arachis hypogaea]QHO33422.1 BTB/POZ domain-containing protein [Arachis hypogaea]